MPFEESDSHVNVNWVLVGVAFSWSSKLTLPEPRGGDDRVAALAIAVEIMPWSGGDSPGQKNISAYAPLAILASG